MIQVSKIGYAHLDKNINNQDYIYYNEKNKVKLVMDGCGSQEYSEVGNRLLVQFFDAFTASMNDVEENFPIIMEIAFEQLIRMCHILQPICFDATLISNLSFTILASIEKEDKFVVYTCGDGYIIYVTKQEEIRIINTDEVIIEDGKEYPKYFVYQYLKNKEHLKYYKEGVSFTRWEFSKDEFKNVGVATDGLRFYTELPMEEQEMFCSLLKEGNSEMVKMYIRRWNDMWRNINLVPPVNGMIPKPKRAKRIFEDDISIVL